MSQGNSDTSPDFNNQDRLFRVWADIGEVVLAVITSPLAVGLAKRLGLLAKASFIPSSGHGNTSALAFLLNISEPGARALAKRRQLPVIKPGDERVYEFPDIAKDFLKSSSDDEENSDESEAPV